MLWRVECHAHTCYSPDSLLSPAEILNTCRHRGIDRIIITDHNTLRGALAARALDPERVILGEEIMTTQGELLAFFVEEEVPAGLSPLEAIRRLRDQGAFISVSHPFDRWRKGGWRLPDLLVILPLVDAIEGFNARCLNPWFNHRAQQLARARQLPLTVGSDAHSAGEIGQACLLLPPFDSAAALRRLLPQAQIEARLSPPWVHLLSRYASWVKRRGRLSLG